MVDVKSRKQKRPNSVWAEPLEQRALLSGTTLTYLTDFPKSSNIYSNLNQQYPHSGTGTPGSGVGTPNASFLFDPSAAAVAAAGYAPNYGANSNLVNNGINFSIVSDASGHDFDEINAGQVAVVPAHLNGVQTVYMLMAAYDGTQATVTFNTASGATQVVTGIDVPDFNGGSINDLEADYTDQTVFQVNDAGGGGTGNSATGDTTNYSLTEVAFTLSSGITAQELSTISVTSSGYDTLLLGVTAASNGVTAAPIYNAAADFSPSANGNGAWSYGVRSTESSAFTPYTLNGPVNLGAPDLGWYNDPGGSPPFIAENFSNATYNSASVSLPPGVLIMHPGGDGAYSDTRFTAPAAGTYTVNTLFTGVDVDGTTTDVHVLQNGATIADGNINGFGNSYSNTTTVTLAAGDTLDFVVGYGNGTYISDSTSLTATISNGTASSPAKSIGGLDPTFGNNGLASHDVGFTSTNGVATDGTQSILIGPIGTSPNQSFGVTRYNGDGSLDISFGSSGVTATRFGSTDDVPTAVSVLSDGHILVAGTATTPDAGSEFAIAEYNADGSLDTSFGTGGETFVSFSKVAGNLSNDVLRAMSVAANGTIYLGGSTDAAGAGNTDFAVTALSAGGALVTSFGNGGVLTADIAGGDDVINSLAVQSNGNVVAAGAATVNGTSEVALARFDTSGTLDKKFGDKGIVTDAVGSVYDSASSVVIQPKGQIVIGGSTASGSGSSLTTDFLLQRYTSTGKLDHSFGNGGTVDTSFGQPSAVTQVLLQSNGSIVASGKTSTTLGGTLDVATARYTTKGALDTSFAGTGKVIVDLATGVVPQTSNAARMLAAAASTLGAEFDAFTNSLQGVVAVTQGGEILDAGNSGVNTVEAELITAGVDLVAKLLSTLPGSILAGLKGSIKLSIMESGTTAASGSVSVEISFATDAAGDNASTPVSTGLHVGLKQGQSKPFKINFVYPKGLAAGSYFLVATVVNGAGVPADLDTSNNAAASDAAVTIAPAFVTLTGTSLTSTPIVAGKSITFSIDITNTGNVTGKGKAEVDFYLSPDQTIASGTSLGVAPLTVSLPAGKGKVYRLKIVAPATIPAGTFNLLGVIDPSDVLGSNDVLVIGATPVVVG